MLLFSIALAMGLTPQLLPAIININLSKGSQRMAFMVPDGVGIIESTMAGLYTGLGVPNAVTVAVVLVYRLLSFWLPLFGFPLILILQRNFST